MGTTTVPRLEGAVPRARAIEIVETLRRIAPEVDAYPHAWGNDWGVTITNPDASDADLYETYQSMYYLGLLTPP